MRILIFVTQFYQISGAEKLALDLAKELSTSGIDVQILSMYSEELPGVKRAAQELIKHNIKVLYLGLPINANTLETIKGVYRLRKLLKTSSFTTIEASSTGTMTIAALASLGLNITTVCGIHAVFKRSMHNTFKHRIWRYVMKANADNLHFYAISSSVAVAWADYINLPLKYVSIIYNAIPDHFFSITDNKSDVYNEIGIPAEAKIILFVGSIMKYKGIDILIDAVGPILDVNDCFLVFVGEGGKSESFHQAEDGFYEKFYETINNANWSARVKFLGNRNDIARLMTSSTLLAHPARTEGFGLVLVEALASGLPVVATNVDGIPEVLNGSGAILIPPEDPLALREAILHILNMNIKDRQEMISYGVKRANCFRMKNRVNSIIELTA